MVVSYAIKTYLMWTLPYWKVGWKGTMDYFHFFDKCCLPPTKRPCKHTFSWCCPIDWAREEIRRRCREEILSSEWAAGA